MKRVQKQFLTAVVLVVGGGGAGLYTLREKVKTPEVRLRELRESQRLFRFGRIDVVSGELRSKTGTLAFSIDEDQKVRLTHPVKWPGNADAFTSMLNHMAGLAMQKRLTEAATPEELSRAGLDKPAATLQVKLRDGRDLTLHIGPLNKLSAQHAVTDANKQIIGLIEPSGFWNYIRPLSEYRTKQVFDTTDADLNEIALFDGQGGLRVELKKNEAGKWRMRTADGDERDADQGIVELFAVRITKNLDADEYIT
ncbi:MAG: DUF4340 domain-containing protein, partial [Myxococcota bacterium]